MGLEELSWRYLAALRLREQKIGLTVKTLRSIDTKQRLQTVECDDFMAWNHHGTAVFWRLVFRAVQMNYDTYATVSPMCVSGRAAQ